MDKPLRDAIKKLGGMSALARAVGCSKQAIRSWKRVPPARVLKLEQATGIPREVIRPDIYPPEDARRRA